MGHQVPMGIATGLFFGKPIGVMLCCFLIRNLAVQMPRHVNWGQLFGVSLLCGIGFTMSLFIGSLAFGGMDNPLAGLDRLGILTGSILSAVVGFFVLKKPYLNVHFEFSDRSRCKKAGQKPGKIEFCNCRNRLTIHQLLRLTNPVIACDAAGEF